MARDLHMGDYINLSITLEVDLSQQLSTDPTNVLPTQLDPGQLVQSVLACIASGNLASEACVKVLNTPAALLKLKEICQEPANRNKTVCVAAQHRSRACPGLPGAAGARPRTRQPARRAGRRARLALGLGRSGTGPWNDAAARRPDHGPAADGLRPVAGQPAGADPSWRPSAEGGETQ